MSKQIVGAAYSNDDKNAIKIPPEPPKIPLENRYLQDWIWGNLYIFFFSKLVKDPFSTVW